MKKLLALIALITVGNAFAYTIKMTNATDGTIKVDVRYGAVGFSLNNRDVLCNRDSLTIDSGASKSIESGACCTQGVTVTAIDGSARGKSIEYAAPQTGLGLSCRGFNCKVSNPSRGQLAAVTVK